jgi:hypothetical protein
MLTAMRVLPSKVGVAPGTTTFQLGAPALCDEGARATVQKMRYFPTLARKIAEAIQDAAATAAPAVVTPATSSNPTKVAFPLPTLTTNTKTVPVTTGPTLTTNTSTAPATAPRPVALNPYAVMEELKGVRGFFSRLFRRNRPVAGLGYILNVGPTANGQPTSEIVATMKNYGPGSYCGTYDKSYFTRGTKGYYYDTQMGGLGAIPSDLQLSRIRGYTPVMSSWVPFQNQTWAPAPWVPPNGTWSPDGIRPIGPPISPLQVRGLRGLGDDAALDPAQQAVLELKRHQDRTFALTVVSTMAIASTAVINIFKHLEDSGKRRKRDLEPVAPVASLSGARRRRRR